jgi:hypothetical protein
VQHSILSSQQFHFPITQGSFFLNWPLSTAAEMNHILSVNESCIYFFFLALAKQANAKALYVLR